MLLLEHKDVSIRIGRVVWQRFYEIEGTALSFADRSYNSTVLL